MFFAVLVQTGRCEYSLPVIYHAFLRDCKVSEHEQPSDSDGKNSQSGQKGLAQGWLLLDAMVLGVVADTEAIDMSSASTQFHHHRGHILVKSSP